MMREMTLEQRTKFKIHQLMKKRKNNLVIKNIEGGRTNEANGPNRSTGFSNSSQLESQNIVNQGRIKTMKINDYYNDQRTVVKTSSKSRDAENPLQGTAKGRSFKELMLNTLGARS